MASVDESTTLPRPPVADEASAAAAEFKRRMMGADRNSLNLAAVRARAEDIRRSLDQAIHALHHNAHNIHWSEALDKFAVLQVQYQNLAEQLRPMLKLWALHPNSVNQTNAAILPIMLATKPLPEMDEEIAALLRQAVANAGGGGGSAATASAAAAGGGLAVPDAAALEGAYEALTSAEDAHNALVRHLTTVGGTEGSGILDPKGLSRLELAKAMRPVAAPPPPQPASQRKRGAPNSVDALLDAVADGKGIKIR